MMTTPFLLSLFLLSLLPSPSSSQILRAVLIDCGASVPSVINGQLWKADTGFITTGTSKNLSIPGLLDSTLSTVRTFPLQNNVNKKFCYVIPVVRTWKYLVRTTYYYGGDRGVNGNVNPPVFDQTVDGTFWSLVNTTEDNSNGYASYYEGIFMATRKTMSVCLAANPYTDSDPFISALEVVLLARSLYNSTNFNEFALRLVARNSFGYNGPLIRSPDDPYDRYWEPFGESDSPVPSFRNVSVSGFWNLPPLKVFQTRLTVSQPDPMQLIWPQEVLKNSTYYIALYFADDRDSVSGSSRVFDIIVNGVTYYRNLNVTPDGVVVFANEWPLIDVTNITLIPAAGSNIGPLINAGEIFEVLPIRRTQPRDVTMMEAVKKSFLNPPVDWNGDPCLPRRYSWTGVKCSDGTRFRIISLNLTGMGLSGSISPRIAYLTALSDIWLGNNNLSGPIPDLKSLKMLKTLHLEDNQLSGEIPSSLGSIRSLNEIFLQNNNLTGQIPSSLLGKPGLNLRTSPGNPFLSPPPS